MKKTAFLVAAVLLAAVFAFKAVFPAEARVIIDKAAAILERDIDYRRVLSGLEEALPVFGGSSEQEAAEDDSGGAASVVLRPVEVQSMSLSRDGAETAVNSGERSMPPAQEAEEPVPDAVAAFLESQREFSDYDIPENVSYDYTPYPGEMAVPVAGYNSSGFGYRIHPIKGELRFHYGTDFAAWTGEEVLAFAGGTVTFAGFSDSYGNYITIDHGDGWESLYAHCSRLMAETGDEVEMGETIALVGETGLATGPHLHFELMKDGVYMNPEYYVN